MNSRSTVIAIAGLIALGLVASAAPSFAQSASRYGPHWELTAFNGYFIAQDLYTAYQNAGNSNGTVGMKNSYTWGGRLGFYPRPYGGTEFSYTRASSEVEVKNSFNGYNPGGKLGEMVYDSYDLNFIGRQENLANPRVTGFGTLGFGWTVTHPELLSTTKLDSQSLFGINFGLGANVALNPALALRLEGRWKVTQTHIGTGSYVYCDYWGYCYSYTSTSYSTGELTAGLSYTLGAKH